MWNDSVPTPKIRDVYWYNVSWFVSVDTGLKNITNILLFVLFLSPEIAMWHFTTVCHMTSLFLKKRAFFSLLCHCSKKKKQDSIKYRADNPTTFQMFTQSKSMHIIRISTRNWKLVETQWILQFQMIRFTFFTTQMMETRTYWYDWETHTFSSDEYGW